MINIKVIRRREGIKVKAIQKFGKKRNWTYQIMTEKKICCVHLNNVKDLLASVA